MSGPAAVPAAPIELADLALDSFRGRPVVVLGLARSGVALTRFLADQGAVVTVYDARPAGELAAALGAIEPRRARLRLGPDIDPLEVLAGQALICTSPSINSRYPTTEPRLRAALAAIEAEGRVAVLSEVDLFLRLCPARTIGVTGTKGKTTTSSLIGAILAAGPAPSVLGGNMGVPLVERLPGLGAQHDVVLELSELQLPTLSRGTDVAVYTQVSSDHLDRHGTLEAYRAVKRRLAELLPDGGVLVRNEDDPVVREYQAPPGALTLPYRQAPPGPGEIGLVDGWVVARDLPVLGAVPGAPTAPRAPRRTGSLQVLPLDEIGVPGRHNVSNVLAAVAVGLLLEVPVEAIRGAVRAFPGVEHRLELVAEHDGVRYVNDSQGTQPDAVMAALESFAPPIVLIAGGRSKGLPIDALARTVAQRAAAAVLIGETAPQLAAAFGSAGLARVEHAADMDAAVALATAIARASRSAGVPGSPPGSGATGVATVLLSPAAASFDMFADYEARGRAFKAAVARVIGTAADDADPAAGPHGMAADDADPAAEPHGEPPAATDREPRP